VRDADAILLATPMYHGSVASPLKTALDYCGFDEFEGTTVGLLAVAGGAFPTGALDHLRAIGRALDAWVLPYQAAIPDSHAQFADGELTDPDLRDRVGTLGAELVRYAGVAAHGAETAAATPADD
jgi:NAD(P)H-dependent FMN reductase